MKRSQSISSAQTQSVQVPACSESAATDDSLAYVRQNIETSITGDVLLKASAHSTKAMHVRLHAMYDKLRISFTQTIKGIKHTFQLCCLSLSHLVVGIFTDKNYMFVMAATSQEKLCCEIYVYPLQTSAKQWLTFFQSKKMTIVRLFHSTRTEISRSFLDTVQELTDSASSKDKINQNA